MLYIPPPQGMNFSNKEASVVQGRDSHFSGGLDKVGLTGRLLIFEAPRKPQEPGVLL